MDWPELVDRLAVLVGIEPSYHDIHGTRHDAPPETKNLVLSALGFDVSSRTAVQDAISEFDDAPWRRCTAKTLLCPAGKVGVGIDVILPADAASSVWRWEIELESTEVRSGEFRPEDLAILATREAGGRHLERRHLSFSEPLPEGYHRFSLASHERTESELIAAPAACYLPAALEHGRRLWGLSTHIYALRSEKNWGIGDFGDLKRLVRLAADARASFVAVNPFHALFPARPEHASPYSPSSRLFLNPAYIEIAAQHVPDAVQNLRRSQLVDYSGVWSAKGYALNEMWIAFEEQLRNHPKSPGAVSFGEFLRDGGPSLERFATFCALDEVLGGQAREYRSWHSWPARFQKPASAAVRTFAAETAERIQFHQYLQFLANRQLGDAQQEGQHAGMSIGIVRDLALGTDPDGADAWAGREAFAGQLRCGAPRDEFHPTGQEWGVLPFNPVALREDYAPFIRLLRSNMRHAGGLRIDHIIGMERQFLVPVGEPPTNGCYVRYPREQLLALVALESRRNKCMVVGEDLGTVPEGLRERMHDAQMFGCSILPFERAEGGRYRPPTDYRTRSVAAAGTHDLPTIRGYWTASDITAREQAGLQGAEASVHGEAMRRADKERLLEALRQCGTLDAVDEPTVEQLRNAVHKFLASSSAQLFAAQLDDLFDEEMQLNLPGTVDAHPNWRRKLSAALAEPRFKKALADLTEQCSARC